MMKQLLLGLMLLVTSGAASAEWTQVNFNVQATYYVDIATIRRNGDFVTMWDLTDLKKADVFDGQSTLSGRSQYEYDCKDEKRRNIALTTFSGQMLGGTINVNNNDMGPWTPVPPGSVMKTLWKIACGK